ncbi:uncharacterized protein MELLADRAFT_94219 [Melampsora larici-populina 98AG31]|uniref:HMG box domain-containing protein n=1 Tax=Melampsora larici-populina (strain 98AG31 / pathotype 3-4-7) TaxID=747676 RepID=F4S6W9_MELLP|nr:uncharacterized protein MELLADRAFT_94219 [Melampsora larici-populina 98AG31]EGF99649.1 hypothetical protein MELLADRAFT_94219 [Melampsora larici-populina 98AG31]
MMDSINTSYPAFASSVSAGFPTPPSSPLVRPLSSPPALSSSSGFLQKVSEHPKHLLENKAHSPPIFSSEVRRGSHTDDTPSISTTQNLILVPPASILSGDVGRVSQPDDTPPALTTEDPDVVSPPPFIISSDIKIGPTIENHDGPSSGISHHSSIRDHEEGGQLSDHTVNHQMAGVKSASDPELCDLPVLDPSVRDHKDHNQNPTNDIITFNNEQAVKSSDRISEQSAVLSKGTAKTKRKTKKARPAYEVAGRLPRPPNSWILYRSEKILEMKSLDLGLAQSILSKEIAARWREEPSEVKKMYERKAEIIKAEHAAKHPDYKYNPKRHRKNGEKSSKNPTRSTIEEEHKDQNKQLTKGKSETHDLHHFAFEHSRDSFNVPPTPKNSISTSTGDQKDEDQIRNKSDEEQRFQTLILDANLYKAFPVLSQLIANQNPNTPLPSASTEAFPTRRSMTIPNQFQDLTLSSNQGIFEHHHQHTDPQLVSPTSWAPPWQPNDPSSTPIDYHDSRNWNRNMSYPLPSIPPDHNVNRFSLPSQLQWTPNHISPNSQQYSNPNYHSNQSQSFDGSHTSSCLSNSLDWQDPRLSNWSNPFHLGSSSDHTTRQSPNNERLDQNGINFGFNSFINDDLNQNHQSLQAFWNLENQ